MPRFRLACALALCTPLAFAQAPSDQVDIIAHLYGLDVKVEPMGVPLSTGSGETHMVGVRAVKVINQSDKGITCEFQVADEDRTSVTSPIFSVASGAQVIERVPGEYSPDKPYAELTCRGTN